jgi:hypothetical protein
VGDFYVENVQNVFLILMVFNCFTGVRDVPHVDLPVREGIKFDNGTCVPYAE